MANLKNTDINDTGYLTLPIGTTAQRPSSPAAGMLRYNSTDSTAEVYDGAAWVAVGTPAVVIVAPSVTTNSASSVTTSSMTLNGNVTSDGGGTVTARGFYFGTNSTVTSNPQYSSGSGTGAFSLSRTGLSAGTTYYFAAYATNSAGTTVGSTVSQATSFNYTFEDQGWDLYGYGNYTKNAYLYYKNINNTWVLEDTRTTTSSYDLGCSRLCTNRQNRIYVQAGSSNYNVDAGNTQLWYNGQYRCTSPYNNTTYSNVSNTGQMYGVSYAGSLTITAFFYQGAGNLYFDAT